MQYQLKVRIEVDDTYDAVHNLFKAQSVIALFWYNHIPPNKIEYIIGPLTDTGVENWKKKFDGVDCKYHAEVFELPLML